MIPTANIAVLDDNEDHLQKLIQTLNAMGCAALPILFRKARPQIEVPLSTLQLLFVDIHLLPGSNPGPQAYDVVTEALERIVAPDSGPYILISWSTHTDLHDELMKHLADNLDQQIPPPAVSACLDKAPYLNPNPNPANDLATAIHDVVGSVPQVTALLSWHDASRIASGEVVNSILGLTERSERFTGSNGPALEKLLTAVAREGAGANAENDLSAAMNEGFGPILTDRLLHGTAVNRKRLNEAWATAVPNVRRDPALEDKDRAALNRMTAISTHDVEHVEPGSRGAVCGLPEGLKSEDAFRAAFGRSQLEVLDEFIRLSSKQDRASGNLTKAEKKKVQTLHSQPTSGAAQAGWLKRGMRSRLGKGPGKKTSTSPGSSCGDPRRLRFRKIRFALRNAVLRLPRRLRERIPRVQLALLLVNL